MVFGGLLRHLEPLTVGKVISLLLLFSMDFIAVGGLQWLVGGMWKSGVPANRCYECLCFTKLFGQVFGCLEPSTVGKGEIIDCCCVCYFKIAIVVGFLALFLLFLRGLDLYLNYFL